jgi:ABC-2 type transport system permease protein
MNKIFLIIRREYWERVRKPSFIVMTLLGPILMAAVFVVPVWIAMQDKSKHIVLVVDESGITDFKKMAAYNQIEKYDYVNMSEPEALTQFPKSDYTIMLWIPKNIVSKGQINLYYKKSAGLILEERLRTNVEQLFYQKSLEDNNIDLKKIESFKPRYKLVTQKLDEKTGKAVKTSTQVSTAIGLGGAIIMYMFIFLYGAQVMRGVMEEKTSRIVEVIVSSVKPFQLMMGKIVGVAMVGLTQFVLWIILTAVFVSIAQATVFKGMDNIPVQNNPMQMMHQGANVTQMNNEAAQLQKQMSNLPEIYNDIMNRNYFLIIGTFVFYFLGGYLLYSALFAAIGSAVDSEADTQQFMFPVTIPIILSFVVATSVIEDPEGPLAFWFSIIPFTSPVVMMVRVPFVNPGWELALSMIMLVLGFIFTTWLAARIYRVGILMYGKKVTWRELGKWLFYKR